MKKDIHIYTVTQLTRDIRFILEDTFSEIWVEGEVSNFKIYPSGHMYFSLKDENSLINCVLFKGNSSRIAFNIEDGLSVLCLGRISVYDKRGQYQLYVHAIEPRGRGALQLAFEQLKEKLYKEGLFDESRKKPLPFLPVHIGVITSPRGAAIRDILKVARRRFSNLEISIRPVRVQGKEAKDEISQAIKEFNEFNQYLTRTGEKDNVVDVIIVARGGGSLEDLWPFNEEIVARAIYASEIPIVSAVGHEIDYTISDFTADLRAPTPSAAAEMVIPSKKDLIIRMREYRERLYLAVRTKIKTSEKTVETLQANYVLRAPMNVLLRMEQVIDDLARAATVCMTNQIELKKAEFGKLAGKLEVLSPLSILERGYSITFKDGAVVKTVKSFKKGDFLRTKFVDGLVTSKVEKVE